ncbi:hypothetical protein FRC09_010134 [Ceratobasidium sp. 395]|nr:hypothetical protein FRC09_010134 [Ceratobasidium sp. 395]
MFHPKCYLVFKYLDIRLASSTPPEVVTASTELMHEAEEWKSTPESLIAAQAKTEVLAHTIWISLRAFEDSSALCVKDMLAAWRIDDRGSIIRAAERLVWRILELLAVIGEMGEGSGVQGDPRFERARGLCAKVINLFGFIPHVQYGSHLGSSMTRGLVIGLGADLRSLMQVAATGALELDAVERLIPRLGASIESDGSGVLEAMVEKCRSPEDNVVIGERGPVTELRDVSGTTEYGFLLNAALERLSWLLRNRSSTTYPTSSLLFADLAEKPEQIMNVETKGLFRYDVESLTSYSPRFNLSSMVDAVYILGAAVCLAVTTLVVHHLILE